jgi:ribose transport system permease protein
MTERQLVRALSALAPWITLIVLFVALYAGLPRFGTGDNLLNQARRAALYVIPAAGMTFVIVPGAIDLSVGSIIALSGLVAAAVVRGVGGEGSAYALPVGIAAALACGTACGTLNGLLTTRLRIPSFVATLGTLGIYRGIAQYSTGGTAVSAPRLRVMDGAVLGVPIVMLAAVVVVGAALILMRSCRFGRYTYAIGGNARAALLSGLPVDRHVVSVYALAGFLWGLGALFIAGLGGAGDPNQADPSELDVIAAVVIGGASLSGGVGGVVGAVTGTLIIVLLRNGCLLADVDPLLQKAIIGAVLVAAVWFDQFRRRRLG